jgi:hypothetical protein
MKFEEFLAMLDPKNPFTATFLRQMKVFNSDDSMFFARKGRDLVEVVQDFCTKGAFPIIDKKLGMILGIGDGYHRQGRALLYNYHTSSAEHPDTPPASLEKGSTWYVMDGMGYFISAMRKDIVVAGNQYQEDRFDKDLFLIYKVDRTL